jgi:hypothetical protein
MKVIHGENTPDFELYDTELSLNNLILYVRNPHICPALYNEIINRSSIRLKEITVKNDCRNPLQQMFLQSKIPDVKSLRRIAFTNPRCFPLLASISRTFRNVDIIRSLYAVYIDCLDDEYGRDVDFSAKIFKTMVKYKGEKIIASKLLKHKVCDKNNNAYGSLHDLIRFYDELQHCDFDFSRNYSIDELHLYLAGAVAVKKTQNRKIGYADKELSLEVSDDTFALFLAQDTHELISIGAYMGLCVGGYVDKAVSKRSTIFVLRKLEDNKPVGCIELRKDTVIQAKGFHNRLLQNQERIFVENWIKDKGLIVGTNDLKCGW